MADARWIGEDDVVALLDLPGAIDALRQALPALDANRAATLPKAHLATPDGATLHAVGGWLGAGVTASGAVVGAKVWSHTPRGAEPLLLLWDAADGSLVAAIEAFALGQLRTAATSGVATMALAPAGATVGALVGTGKQAVAQAAALLAAAPLTELRVHSPDPDRRAAFAARAAAADLAVEVVTTASVAEAVDGAQVITLATRASEPILHAPMVTASAHVNAIGAITAERAEVAPDLVAVCSLVVADDPDTARRLAPRELGDVEEVVALSALLARPALGLVDAATGPEGGEPDDGRFDGTASGTAGGTAGTARPDDADLTLFKAMGLGLSDVVLGATVVALAVASGRGVALPERSHPMPSLVRRIPG